MREALSRYTRFLAREGLISGSEGNLSARQGERILITPSGGLKAELSPEEICEVDLSGRILSGRPTSELLMHLEIYRRHPEVHAVVHTHPPYTLALSLAGHDFREHLLYEGEILLGEVARVPPKPPGTKELAEAVACALGKARVAVLERHGAVSVGRDLSEAVNLTLVLEKVSRVTYLARLLKRL